MDTILAPRGMRLPERKKAQRGRPSSSLSTPVSILGDRVNNRPRFRGGLQPRAMSHSSVFCAQTPERRVGFQETWWGDGPRRGSHMGGREEPAEGAGKGSGWVMCWEPKGGG